jgi:hypothetical protein
LQFNIISRRSNGYLLVFDKYKGDLSMVRRKWTKEEIEEYRKKQNTVCYFNKEHSNFFVSKAYGMCSTNNLYNR